MGDYSAWFLFMGSRIRIGKIGIEREMRHSRWYRISVNHLTTILGLGALVLFGGPAHGQSLNDQIQNQLGNNCSVLLDGDAIDPWNLGPNLFRACDVPTTGSGSSGGASGAAQTSTLLPSAAVEERLSRARDDNDETGTSSADIEIGGGISLFVTGEYEDSTTRPFPD